ncbi:MAG: HD domain-containing protein [Clostridia bacterium]|nr:HD domain-containing protein [Clostridia bacterium]
MKLSNALEEYIQNNIFPIYNKNDQGHNLEHIKYVINRSIKFADTIPDIDYNIVYTVAAYHDIGHHIDPKKHELISAEIMYADDKLKEFFNDEERIIIKEAIEDHRASSNHEPRSIYGKIVSTADRNNTVEACLRRSYCYNKKLHPEFNDEQIFEDCHYHLNDKFGENGYAKFYFKDEEYEKFLTDIRDILANKDRFIEIQRRYINELKNNGVI